MASIEIGDFIKQQKQKNITPIQPNINKRYMTVEEYAVYAKKTPDGIRKMLQRGQLVGEKHGRSWRIPVEGHDPDELMAENEELKLENVSLRSRIDCIKALLLLGE